MVGQSSGTARRMSIDMEVCQWAVVSCQWAVVIFLSFSSQRKSRTNISCVEAAGHSGDVGPFDDRATVRKDRELSFVAGKRQPQQECVVRNVTGPAQF